MPLHLNTAEQPDEFGVHRLHDLLGGVERLRHVHAHGLVADSRQHAAHHPDVHVGLEQRGAELAEDLVDVGSEA
jgi:hypothetical protein